MRKILFGVDLAEDTEKVAVTRCGKRNTRVPQQETEATGECSPEDHDGKHFGRWSSKNFSDEPKNPGGGGVGKGVAGGGNKPPPGTYAKGREFHGNKNTHDGEK